MTQLIRGLFLALSVISFCSSAFAADWKEFYGQYDVLSSPSGSNAKYVNINEMYDHFYYDESNCTRSYEGTQISIQNEKGAGYDTFLFSNNGKFSKTDGTSSYSFDNGICIQLIGAPDQGPWHITLQHSITPNSDGTFLLKTYYAGYSLTGSEETFSLSDELILIRH